MSVFTKILTPPKINRREVLRYSGVIESTAEIEDLLDSCIDEAKNSFSYKVCYTELDKKQLDDRFANLSCLDRCDRVIIFAATVGIKIDRLIAKYGIVSPSRALMFQALGAERIESLCDAFCREYDDATTRFSPGYSKLTLESQKYIFSLLEPSRHIGLTLNSNLLMSPSKSVTAVFGIRRT